MIDMAEYTLRNLVVAFSINSLLFVLILEYIFENGTSRYIVEILILIWSNKDLLILCLVLISIMTAFMLGW